MTTEPSLEFHGNEPNDGLNPILQAKLDVAVGPVLSLAWSPDGRMLALS